MPYWYIPSKASDPTNCVRMALAKTAKIAMKPARRSSRTHLVALRIIVTTFGNTRTAATIVATANRVSHQLDGPDA